MTLYKAHIEYTDECGNFMVRYDEYTVTRETNSFWFINEHQYKTMTERKVCKDAPNAFAFDTKEKALLNLLARRKRRQVLLEWSLSSNEKVIAELYKMAGIKNPDPELKYQYL